MVKIYKTADEAIKDIVKDDMIIHAGGFGLCGIPENIITAIAKSGVKNLTIISNNCGIDDFGLGIILKNNQIKKMISSYVGENKLFDLYTDNNQIVKTNEKEDLLIYINGILQRPTAYTIIRSEDEQQTDKIEFTEAPKWDQNESQISFWLRTFCNIRCPT